MRKKTKQTLISILIISGVGIAYYMIVTLTPFYIPCPVKLVTGHKCPGCGISTMLIELSRLNFRGAFFANPFLFITFPFLLFEIIFNVVYSVKGKKNPKANRIVLIIYIILLLAFGLLRNVFCW